MSTSEHGNGEMWRQFRLVLVSAILGVLGTLVVKSYTATSELGRQSQLVDRSVEDVKALQASLQEAKIVMARLEIKVDDMQIQHADIIHRHEQQHEQVLAKINTLQSELDRFVPDRRELR